MVIVSSDVEKKGSGNRPEVSFPKPESAYGLAMTIEDLTPEATAIMKSLMDNPHAVEDSSTLELLKAERLVMGNAQKMHLTAQGGRMLQQMALREMN